MKQRRSFLIRSWVDLHHVCKHSTCIAFHFRDYQNYFCLPLTLFYLDLWTIPHSGYFSPEAMVTGLSVLTSLESLVIEFESPRSRPDRKSRRPPPPTRTLLPVLTQLGFKGVNEYLEDLVARIDAPLLDKLTITFFHQLIFDTPQLTQFISRTPKFKAHDEARVVFSNWDVTVTLPQTFDGELKLGISCRQSDWQLSSLAQVCSSSFPQALIPTVEHLYIQSESWQLRLARRHREQPMAGTFPSIYRCEGSLHILGIHATVSRPPCKSSSGKE